MNNIALVVIAVSLTAAPAALAQEDPPWDCGDMNNLPQQGLNYCAYQDYLAIDEELNRAWSVVYTEIRSRDGLMDEDFQGWPEALLAAQRAWIEFRDAHCVAEGFMFRGGTMEPLIVTTCKTALTKDRIKQLYQLVETY